MSDAIKHECGIAAVRLLKPLNFYKEKYGTPLYGLNKLYLLMQKQHNRGQDGAGVGVVKLGMTKGQRFMSRYRSNSPQAISDIFQKISSKIREAEKLDKNIAGNSEWLKKNVSFVGELMMGHLRYGTHGKNEVESCHPFIKNQQSSTRSLIMCGNFNLTNIDQLGGKNDGAEYDQPDTAVVLDHVSAHLEDETNRVYQQLRHEADTEDSLRQQIAEQIDFARVLRDSAKEFDGGYNMAGLTGAGHAFVMRDPNGIRPSYYYADDEVVVMASERPAIQTAFNISIEKIHEIKPGHALIVERNGTWAQHEIQTPGERKSCSFERIYFSRGSDVDIYNERKKLGELLMPKILEEIEHDYEHTVFSFIPNTAEVAFYGMIKGGEDQLNEWKKAEMRKPGVLGNDALVDRILSRRLKIEKIAIKDIKLRTFITQDADRNEMVAHVYDITYGSIRAGVDSMVVIDDSIVRGTTLKESIIKMLDRLGPKKIVIVSSAPQIRYPDCYGIDMSRMKDFVAFRAAVALLKERGMDNVIDDVYDKCLAALELEDSEMANEVKAIYAPFTAEEIADKCAELLTEPSVNAEVKIIFQSIENLHDACPSHRGDWYFTGNYPTPGGNRVVNKAFVNYMEGVDARAY
ncbi:MAG TPA: amidophosphoribosyltransferase [Chitinophagales bacterium]|nr:amidophosphoribosyltransferase [Chitinophagales bacterium]